MTKVSASKERVMVITVLICYFQYLTELGCPYAAKERLSVLDWILGYAVRLEYGDDGKYTCL